MCRDCAERQGVAGLADRSVYLLFVSIFICIFILAFGFILVVIFLSSCASTVSFFIVQLSHSPNRDDHSVVSCSQQERREPCSLNSARSGVQQAARAYSLIWSGLFACRGVVGGRVGSGFDKFLRGFPELDGTCEHSERLPHSRLGDRKSAASPIHGNTWHCAAFPYLADREAIP